jgi:large subunit ribosomal protein L25
MIPAVVYGKGIDPVTVTVTPKDFGIATAGEGGRNALLTLVCDGSLNGSMVIVADTFSNALRGNICHVDLHKISLTDKLRVEVQVNLVGTALGVKEGGLLDVAMHTIEVECLPQQIPEHIDVDVTALTIGHSIHLGDVTPPAGVKILGDPRASVVSVLGKVRDEAPAAG